MLSLPDVLVEKEIKDSFVLQRLNREAMNRPNAYRLSYHRIILVVYDVKSNENYRDRLGGSEFMVNISSSSFGDSKEFNFFSLG